MKLSTRLLLPLLATVVVVMIGYAALSLAQRESVMLAEGEREARAYATALGLALERAASQADAGAIQEMIDRIDRDPNIYGVLVYDLAGRSEYVSSPLVRAEPTPADVIRSVLAGPEMRTQRRSVLGEESLVVYRALVTGDGAPWGVLEVVQPLSSVEEQLARTRLRFALNTLTLLIAMTLLFSWLVRRHLAGPLDRFVEAARALGSGELSHRIEADAAAGELGDVAAELNRMADRLEEANRELLQKADERLALERRLAHAETLAEVGQLAAGLAHEIGAPLHVIRGRADLVLRGERLEADQRRHLSIIVGQIDRISVTVRNLLGYARRREPQLVEADLVGVVRGVIDFLDPARLRSGIRFTSELPDAELLTRCDPDQLHQVVLNVVLNALQAVADSEAPPAVAVRVSRVERPDGAAARVEVEDNGPGIPPETRDRVFEPFYSTKRTTAGTGLGLALARAVVEDHHGAIAIVAPSGLEWSTRVRIELPLRPARDAAGPGGGELAEAAPAERVAAEALHG